MLTEEGIQKTLHAYYAPLPLGIESKVRKYMELLHHWGRRISLTSLTRPEDILRVHFGESIFALSCGMATNGRLADVGSGAGFPGLALKLAAPGLSVVLIEPNKKKCAFLHEVVRALDFQDVAIVPSGFESVSIQGYSFSCVSSRALKIERRFLDWTERLLSADGEVVLWLDKADCVKMREMPTWRWNMPALIPGTHARFVLTGKLTREIGK